MHTTDNDVREFKDSESRWSAVVNRDAKADGQFYYSVKTTGVYCRPSCAARLALRQNVAFYATLEEAEQAGFRECKRCKPRDISLAASHSAAIARACRIIEEADEVPNLDTLSASVGLSPHYFHRLFKKVTGLTPKAYAAAQRNNRMREGLTSSPSVTRAIYDAGFNSSSRFYESSDAVLGMLPKTYREGGRGVAIRFAIGECWLGSILVASSEKGVCAILLGDDPEKLMHDLEDQFPKAKLVGGDADYEALVGRVVGFLEAPSAGLELPLDIRGTAFQQRVWQALTQIPVGKTMSYAEIAAQIGRPKSVRAVAQACGANALAVAIPCHRVIRNDGGLSGYRWGVERKEKLLQRERNGK